eukprot:gene7358-8140_t
MITIVYASETGNSEELAYGLQDSLLQRQLGAVVANISDLTFDALAKDQLVIFIISTSGDGEVPSSMKAFWPSLLRKSLSAASLNCLRFAVFGLGDSSYEFYNAAARKLFARLRQLGGQALVPLGLGDDQAKFGYLTAWTPWREQLMAAIENLVGQGFLIRDSYLKRLAPGEIYTVRVLDAAGSSSSKTHRATYFAAHTGRVVSNDRMTAVDWDQDVRLLTLSLEEEEEGAAAYRPGDVAAIYYTTPEAEVTEALHLLQLEPDAMLDIVCHHPRAGRLASVVCTAEEVLRDYLDISARPRRSFFAALAPLAQSDEERAKLEEIEGAEGIDIYYDYCLRARRSHVEVMKDFKSLKLSLAALLPALPLIQPRQYSIASAPAHHRKGPALDLCVALATYRTNRGRKLGLCSRFLTTARPGEEVVYNLLRGPLSASQLSCEGDMPLVLVGPGTGVASMRAVLQQVALNKLGHERYHALLSTPAASVHGLPSEEGGLVQLFFGCRREQKDFLFGQEWPRYPPHVAKVHFAFSQDGEGLEKVYVQHRIREAGEEVWAALRLGGAVYIAGSAKLMPRGVRKALLDVLVQHGDMDAKAAEVFLLRLAAQKKYIVEAWS